MRDAELSLLFGLTIRRIAEWRQRGLKALDEALDEIEEARVEWPTYVSEADEETNDDY